MIRAELVGGPFDGTLVYLPLGTAVYEVPLPLDPLSAPMVAETEPLPRPLRRAVYRRRADCCRGPVRFIHESLRS